MDDREQIRESSEDADHRLDKVHLQKVGELPIEPSRVKNLRFAPVGSCGHSTSSTMSLVACFERHACFSAEKTPATSGTADNECMKNFAEWTP